MQRVGTILQVRHALHMSDRSSQAELGVQRCKACMHSSLYAHDQRPRPHTTITRTQRAAGMEVMHAASVAHGTCPCMARV